MTSTNVIARRLCLITAVAALAAAAGPVGVQAATPAMKRHHAMKHHKKHHHHAMKHHMTR
jgi:hypothetical protein